MLERVIHKITERPESLSRNGWNYEERNAAWPVPIARSFRNNPVSSEYLPRACSRVPENYVAEVIGVATMSPSSRAFPRRRGRRRYNNESRLQPIEARAPMLASVAAKSSAMAALPGSC